MDTESNRGDIDRQLTVFRCGGDNCPIDDQPHVWDGPTVNGELGENGTTWESATCSKCGLDAMAWSMMNLP